MALQLAKPFTTVLRYHAAAGCRSRGVCFQLSPVSTSPFAPKIKFRRRRCGPNSQAYCCCPAQLMSQPKLPDPPVGIRLMAPSELTDHLQRGDLTVSLGTPDNPSSSIEALSLFAERSVQEVLYEGLPGGDPLLYPRLLLHLAEAEPAVRAASAAIREAARAANGVETRHTKAIGLLRGLIDGWYTCTQRSPLALVINEVGSSASSRRGSLRSRVAEEGAAPAVEQWKRDRAIVHGQLEATARAESVSSSAAADTQPLGAEAAQHAAKLLAKLGRAEARLMQAWEELQAIESEAAFVEWRRLVAEHEALVCSEESSRWGSIGALRRWKAKVCAEMGKVGEERGAAHQARSEAALGEWLTEGVGEELLRGVGEEGGEVMLLSEVQMKQSLPRATAEFDLLIVRAVPSRSPDAPPAKSMRSPAREAKLIKTVRRGEGSRSDGDVELFDVEVLAVVECKHSASQIRDHILVLLDGLSFYSSADFKPELVFLKGSRKVLRFNPKSFALFQGRSVERVIYLACDDRFAPLALRKIVLDELLHRGSDMLLRHDGSVAVDEKLRSRVAWIINKMTERALESTAYIGAMVEAGNLWFLAHNDDAHVTDDAGEL